MSLGSIRRSARALDRKVQCLLSESGYTLGRQDALMELTRNRLRVELSFPIERETTAKPGTLYLRAGSNGPGKLLANACRITGSDGFDSLRVLPNLNELLIIGRVKTVRSQRLSLALNLEWETDGEPGLLLPELLATLAVRSPAPARFVIGGALSEGLAGYSLLGELGDALGQSQQGFLQAALVRSAEDDGAERRVTVSQGARQALTMAERRLAEHAVSLTIEFLEDLLACPVPLRVLVAVPSDFAGYSDVGRGIVAFVPSEGVRRWARGGQSGDFALVTSLAASFLGIGCRVSGPDALGIEGGIRAGLALAWLSAVDPGSLRLAQRRYEELSEKSALRSLLERVQGFSDPRVVGKVALETFDALRTTAVGHNFGKLVREHWGSSMPSDRALSCLGVSM